MKTKTLILSTLLTGLLILAACGDPTPAANTPATSDAAAQATGSAPATAELAPQATSTPVEGASQSAMATAVQATLTAQPTPDYATLTESQLTALINEAVNSAMNAAASAAESTSQATSDGTVTQEEAAATTTSLYQGDYEIAYAKELIAAYSSDYGEYTGQALDTLNAMEADLDAISQSLAEIDAILSQGAETASAASERLNAAAEALQASTGEAKGKAKSWSDQVRSSISEREAAALGVQPSQVESDRTGALIQAHDFLEAFKSALTDGKFSPKELDQISQLGANARASLLKGGDPQFKKFNAIIESLTRNAARGEWGSARTGAGVLEHALPARPQRK